MKIVATTSLPAVDRPNADRWNAACSRQNSNQMSLIGFLKHFISSVVSIAQLVSLSVSFPTELVSHSYQWVQNSYSNREIELSKHEMELEIDFKKRNHSNRKWNYFSHFRASDQKTPFTKKFLIFTQEVRPKSYRSTNYLDLYGPMLAYLDLFSLILSILAHLDPFGPNWTNFDLFWTFWIYWDLFRPI